MGKLEKVIVENGITYVLGEDDIYYPDLQLPEGTNYNIGKFGHMRCEYLKEFKHGYYMELLLDGRLNEYLHEIDEACYAKTRSTLQAPHALPRSGSSAELKGLDRLFCMHHTSFGVEVVHYITNF